MSLILPNSQFAKTLPVVLEVPWRGPVPLAEHQAPGLVDQLEARFSFHFWPAEIVI